MTKEEVLKLAREAGFETDCGPLLAPSASIKVGGLYVGVQPLLERFAALVAEAATEAANARATSSWTLMCKKMVAAENEACAVTADEHMQECEGKSFGVGKAIRARGQA